MKEFGTKVGKLGLDEIFVAGLTKYVEERALAMTPVGNSTFISGIVKLGAGMGINYGLGHNKYGKAVALGFGIDGVEDILQNLIGMIGGNGIGNSGVQVI